MDEGSGITRTGSMISHIVQRRSLLNSNIKTLYRRSWPLVPSKDREKLDQILSSYNSKGLPQQPELLSPAVSDLPSTIFEMETDWRKIVTGALNLTRQQQSQQEVIWELLNTEIKYIQSQKVVVDLFMSCLINIQNEQILNDVEIKKIFSNINDVLTANCIFWRDYLMKMLKEARETHQPFNPSLMKDGFKKFPEIFAPYQLYCAEQEQCQSYIKSMYLKNELFRNFIMWAEAKTNICKRLKLNDLIVKPMQRLTRYHLLLRRIMEKSKDNPLQQQDMKEMISSVETFTQYVNLVVGQKQEHEKLVAVALKIDMYEGVEAPNDECIKLLQKYNANFDLTAPMFGCGHEQSRVLIYHSPLRYKESPQFKTDVECYLFTDLLLICKPKKTMDKLKVVKPPIRIDRLVVEELKDKGLILLIHLNEFNIPQSAFTLHADSSVIRVWMEHIKKAKEMYKEACEMASCHRQQLSAKNDSVPENMTEIQNNKAQMSPLISTDNDNEFEENTQPELHSVDSKTGERQNSIKIDDGHEKFVHSWSQIFFPETTSSENEQSQMDKCRTSILDRDDLKTKTFQRRTERRYLTADAIQELKQKERDPEIHKRLSWNLGTSAKTDLENRDGSFKQKFYITGSDQSIHNSSGVGSDLDLNPKNEPSEDSEIVQGPHQGAALMGTSEQDKSLQLSSLKLKSKSMTDIAKLLTASPSEIKDGISSVILPSSNSYQGLTNSQVSKLKMIMLLNTTDESKV